MSKLSKQKNRSTFAEVTKQLEDLGCEVRSLTPYQFRINGYFDLYPSNKRWHNIKNNHRGSFEHIPARLLVQLLNLKFNGSQKLHERGEDDV